VNAANAKASNRPRESFAPLVARVARQWRRAVDRHLQPFGLTEATWLPLVYLSRSEAPMRQKNLAAALTLDGSSVVRLLDSLQTAGLIERREEDGDRRAKIITLTSPARTIIEQVEAASRQVRNAALSGLSDQALDDAIHLLDHVLENLGRQPETEN
jgi:MarR family transcriptional regulator for hemolysin